VKQLFRGSTTGKKLVVFFFVDLFTTWTMWVIDYLLECVDTTALLTADPSTI
jgi:hypothetical protein